MPEDERLSIFRPHLGSDIEEEKPEIGFDEQAKFRVDDKGRLVLPWPGLDFEELLDSEDDGSFYFGFGNKLDPEVPFKFYFKGPQKGNVRLGNDISYALWDQEGNKMKISGLIEADEGKIAGFNIIKDSLVGKNIELHSGAFLGGEGSHIIFKNDAETKQITLDWDVSGDYFTITNEGSYLPFGLLPNGEIFLAYAESSGKQVNCLATYLTLSPPNFSNAGFVFQNGQIDLNLKGGSGASRFIFSDEVTNYFFMPGTDNTCLVGASNKRFKDGYFTDLHVANDVTVGDIVFKNKWRIIEDKDNLIFVNSLGEKVLQLDNDGGFSKLNKEKIIFKEKEKIESKAKAISLKNKADKNLKKYLKV